MTTTTMHPSTEAERGGKAKHVTLVTLWVLQVLLAANFLFAGGGKLAGVDMMVGMFAEIGLGQWFRYFVGVLEVIGALFLLTPRFAALAGWGLALVMAGAVLTELLLLSGNALMPLILLVLLVIVARGRAASAGANRSVL